MNDLRRDEEHFILKLTFVCMKPLCTQHILEYIKENYRPWLSAYLESKKSAGSGYNAIMRLRR
ncbi:hypothetical protein JG688_00018409, partial [Phytophthora aleatoria]